MNIFFPLQQIYLTKIVLKVLVKYAFLLIYVWLFHVDNLQFVFQVIAAEGEQKASRALREASEVIGDSPAALQLRYLQVWHRNCLTMVLKGSLIWKQSICDKTDYTYPDTISCER